MTTERSMAPGFAEPPPPASTHAAAEPDRATAAMRLQILSTEHWSLLASRSLAWNESFSRAGMFLSALSGAIVALALVAQATQFGDGFVLFALVILPVVLFVGLTTFFRLGATNYHDAICIMGMNRIRAMYVRLAPDLEPLFVMGIHDDVRGIGITMGVDPAASQAIHLIAATPTLVSTLNSVIAAVIAGVVMLRLRSEDLVALAVGLAVGVLVMAAHLAYGRLLIRRGQAATRPLFPTPSDGQGAATDGNGAAAR